MEARYRKEFSNVADKHPNVDFKKICVIIADHNKFNEETKKNNSLSYSLNKFSYAFIPHETLKQYVLVTDELIHNQQSESQ